jgi:anti-sigma factor RsiW
MKTFQCGEHTGLISYVYDECDALERAAIDAHVTICAACAAEVAALESTRTSLASWAPPAPELGFQIVRPVHPVLASSERNADEPAKETRARHRPFPAWAQAVAASLIFAAGLSLGVMRGIGSEPPESAAAPLPAAVASSTVSANTVSPSDLQALERRLRAEMSRIQIAPVPRNAAATSVTASQEELLARVRTLIEESERRQQRELAWRTAQIMRDVDSQRQADLTQIQNNFGQIEGLTGAEVREQRQMLNYLIRASEQR